jgi:hypothetical protein
MLDSILTPEGAAVIFGISCLLFGLLLVLDSKRKPGETQDYRLMQRVYGWILIIIPCLFLLGGLYMKYSGNSESKTDMVGGESRGSQAEHTNYIGEILRSEVFPKSLTGYQKFQWTYMNNLDRLLWYIGLYRFENESNPLYQAYARDFGFQRKIGIEPLY